jgi:hypothetical protein
LNIYYEKIRPFGLPVQVDPDTGAHPFYKESIVLGGASFANIFSILYFESVCCHGIHSTILIKLFNKVLEIFSTIFFFRQKSKLEQHISAMTTNPAFPLNNFTEWRERERF